MNNLVYSGIALYHIYFIILIIASVLLKSLFLINLNQMDLQLTDDIHLFLDLILVLSEGQFGAETYHSDIVHCEKNSHEGNCSFSIFSILLKMLRLIRTKKEQPNGKYHPNNELKQSKIYTYLARTCAPYIFQGS